MPSNLLLGVNVDHVVTLRQARYRQMLESPNAEPSVLAAALLAEQSGAHSITIHLRADRRHIQDADVFLLRREIKTKMNLEMGNTAEILAETIGVSIEEIAEITTENAFRCFSKMPRLAA